MKIYKVSITGIIEREYKNIDEFKESHPDEELLTAKDFRGGYIGEVELAKIIIGGTSHHHREVLELKRDIRNLEQDLEVKEQDYKTQQERNFKQRQENESKIAELTKKHEQELEQYTITQDEIQTYKTKIGGIINKLSEMGV